MPITSIVTGSKSDIETAKLTQRVVGEVVRAATGVIDACRANANLAVNPRSAIEPLIAAVENVTKQHPQSETPSITPKAH